MKSTTPIPPFSQLVQDATQLAQQILFRERLLNECTAQRQAYKTGVALMCPSYAASPPARE
jgi:hypothetical protein